jgi:acyl transferase domain-containing protein/NADPH-dependent curcumin reductase CurA
MSTSETSHPGSEIAVVGMAGRLPGAANLDQFWRNLRDGVESIATFSEADLIAAGESAALIADPDYVRAQPVLADIDKFDAEFFGFSPQDAAVMDPQHRIFLETGWEALENAGHDPARFDGNIGVFAACGMNTYMMYHLVTNPQVMRTVGEWLVRHTGNDMNFLATRLSYELGLKGPSMNVQTACSSALVAIHVACQSLLSGECDMALAGGSVIALPQGRGYLYRKGEILSPDGHCRAFDADAAGTLFGSGAGIVVLRRLSDALADGDQVLAVIRGSAINNDGRSKVGYLAPSVEGQSRAVVEALAVSGVHPDTISYVEAHGTGTLIGDPIEITGLTQAYRQHTSKKTFCAIGSLKSNIGHLGEAAGVAGFMKTVLSLQHGQIPPSLHYTNPNPQIAFAESPFFVNTTLREWRPNGAPRRAGVTALGAGGTNCHVIVEEAPVREPSSKARAQQLLVLSARTPDALDAAAANLARHLEESPDDDLADAAYTLQAGRKAFAHRKAVVVESREAAIAALKSGRDVVTGRSEPKSPPIVFLFPGGGSQYPGMGRGVYASEAVFRNEMDRCLGILRSRYGIDLGRLLFPSEENIERAARELERSTNSILSVFVTEYALARLWMSWGINPSSMSGHSLGEYTAACLAGVFSLEDALAIVKARGDIFEQLPAGAMLSVALPEEEVRSLLTGRLSLAAVNAPSLCVLSGPIQEVDALERALLSRDVEVRRLHISVAAHSGMLDPFLPEFSRFLKTIDMAAPSIPFISNVTGDWIRPEQAVDPEYWVRHLRQTVQFSGGLAEVLRRPGQVLLEVGPGRTMSVFARQQPAQPVANLVSLPHPNEGLSDFPFLLGTFARLWLTGVDVDWAGFHSAERRHRVPLPTYPFQRQRYWIEAGNPTAVDTATQPSPEKRSEVGDWFYRPVWRSERPSQSSISSDGDLLIFADEAGLGDAIADQLQSAPRSEARDAGAVRLEFPVPGDTDLAQLVPDEHRAPGPGEVEIAVRTAALNFADVLKITGLLPDKPFGMECAGTIVRTGSAVVNFEPGDEVVAVGPDSFRSRVIRDARFVARKPARLSWREAATIPAAFITAWYALDRIGRLKRGDRVLIHAASGGVGLAAVQIARARGAEVFATAGNPEKRAYLESIGIAHVFSSRTVDFAREIRTRTAGRGLDVVLNSLTGPVLAESLRLLGNGGRFLELGRTEIWSPERVREENPSEGITYHPIDLTDLLRDDPDLYGQLLQEVVARVDSREWQPLTSHLYPVADAVSAFRLMLDAKHIGKIVLSFEPPAARTYVVEPGSSFRQIGPDRFELNPGQPDDYHSLFEALGGAARQIKRIAHLWNVTPADQGHVPIELQLERSFWSPLFLAQAIGRQELDQPIDLCLISNALHQVSGEVAVSPGKAALLGPVRVIPREFPNVVCRSVDVKLPVAAALQRRRRLVEQLCSELGTDHGARIIALRGEDRWVQEHERVRLESLPDPALRDRGVYLITGGLGGLGLEVAEHLAAAVRARLVLVGRTPMPPRSEWDQIARERDEADDVARRIRKVQACERLGAQVLIAQADVADADSMRQALSVARREFGVIHGVFHVAGALEDGVMQLKTRESATRVLRPKVQGTLVLDELLADEPLDFIALFSSVSAVLGLPGQVDYTAANAFLDAFAQSKAADGATRVVSIGWSAWQDVGIAANASKTRRRAERSGAARPSHPWLEHVRRGPSAETVYSTAFSPSNQWMLGEHAIEGSEAVLPGTGYLELIRAAFGAPTEGRAVEISNIFFLSPFVVRQGETRDLEVVLSADGEITIQSNAGTHVTGRVRELASPVPPRVDIAAIEARCDSREATPGGFLSQNFMKFGSRWANIESLRYGTGEALLTLALPKAFQIDLEMIRLHPALLDMATGGAQKLIPGFDASADFYVPFSYGRLVLFRGLPERFVSHVRFTPGGGRGTALFDVSLFNETGEPVAEIEGFCMKRVADRQVLVRDLTRTGAAPDDLRARHDAGGALADDMLRQGMTPGEGRAVLGRLLSAATGPQILVSPVDLAYWSARVDREAQGRAAASTRTETESSSDDLPRSATTDDAVSAGGVESRLTQIWSELLGVKRIGLDDNFFDLGGHSLLAVRLLARIERTFRKSVPLQSLFERPTIRQTAELCRDETQTREEPALVAVSRERLRVSIATLEEERDGA